MIGAELTERVLPLVVFGALAVVWRTCGRRPVPATPLGALAVPLEAPADDPRVRLLADLVSAESYCDDPLDMRRVATVVANRVDAPAFPDTYRAVIYARGQFPSTRRPDFGQADVRCDSALAIAQTVVAGRRYLPPEVHYFYNPANPSLTDEWRRRLERGTRVIGRDHHFASLRR